MLQCGGFPWDAAASGCMGAWRWCAGPLRGVGHHSTPPTHPTSHLPTSLLAGRYAPRDLTLLAYLLLSTCIFLTRALPLSALVLVLNVVNLTVCLALKGVRPPALCPRAASHAPPRLCAC